MSIKNKKIYTSSILLQVWIKIIILKKQIREFRTNTTITFPSQVVWVQKDVPN